ncbi:flagellar FLiS export co-chaperone [uncultured Helicobacter sp.]|uniref:flagellar FLiS export co-chaperone n=1 Tax=uncultured Helicobacter sp. TaxID=175537 RepID=UPI0026240908|nr:flagellar FLiS export co-chaperone [uncultured Helicobacter sp.]
MQDILSTFQKHIGAQFNPQDQEANIYTPSSIHKFGENIKGANEFIGTLQSASIQDLYIKKANIKDVIDNASFMGMSLFDTEFNMTFNSKSYLCVIENPLLLCPNDTAIELDSQEAQEPMNALIAYTEDKLQEISHILVEISEALVAPSTPASREEYNFEDFSPSQFTQMFKA